VDGIQAALDAFDAVAPDVHVRNRRSYRETAVVSGEALGTTLEAAAEAVSTC
jgi:hypothetical protein